MYNRSLSLEENGISRPGEDVEGEKQGLPGDPVVAKVGKNDSRSKGGRVLLQLFYSEGGWELERKKDRQVIRGKNEKEGGAKK